MRARILIAEDDAILALRIKKTVEAMGYDAAALAATGEDAVRLAQELRPDVVLMDIRLRGETSGLEAAASIHARSETPVIYVTAYSDERLIEQAARTAPYAYLTKPIRDRELHAAIEMVLYKSRTDRALSHLNRVLRSVRDVNQLITRERDPLRLMEQACQILLRTSGYAFVWIVPSEPEGGSSAPLAHAGSAVELLEWAERQRETGAGAETPFAKVLRTRQPLTTRDLPAGLSNPGAAGGGVAIVPMMHAEQVFGCLCVYVTPRDGFDDDEIGLLQELAGDLAFALHGLEEAARRERAEQALRASEERFRALFEDNPSMYFTVDAQGAVLSVNPFGAEQLGYSVEELVGRPVLDVCFADDRPAVVEQLAACVANARQVTHWELRKVRKDGSLLWVHEAARCVEGPEGQPVVLVVCADVTDVKRAEEALAESNENWHRLVEYQPTGNVVHRDGRILYANQAGLRIAGVTHQEQLLDRGILEFVHADWREATAARLQALTNAGSCETTELKLVRAGGEPVDVEMTSLPVTYLGQPAIQSVFWDITERRRTEEQLRRVQKLDSVGRLAAGIAHDFNNMLQGILGHAQLLMCRLHPSDARVQHAEGILAAAMRCADLSRQLLAFSRRQVLDLRLVDLRDVVKRMESLLRGALREDVRVQLTVSAEPCLVKADVGQLEQILMNLAVNAQDAMPQGGTLKIEVAPSVSGELPAADDAGPGPRVELIVSDTGCGMDTFTREHAFEPFFTSKEPGKGTGLGLAMVHGIVKQHGGSIQLESQVSAGATFRIRLPGCSEGVAEQRTSLAATGPIGNETVLVVEDTATVLRVTVSVLQSHGYSVLSAENARAGLALLDRHEGGLDLLLTDVVMPDMDGKQLAARVRARFPAVKVLFMSGHDTAVVASHGVLDEGVALIGKPFSIHELTTRVRAALDGA